MDFSESFSVDAAPEEVWGLLTDVERIAPCLPGAQLQEIDGEDYHGIVKVKVGPITSQYKGTARFEQVDEAEHKIVLTAQGRDTKGAGNASAKINVSLEDDAAGDASGGASATQVMVDVHLDLKGKVAQFGRGVLADVSGKLMAKFAQNLSEMIAAGQSEAGSGETASSGALAGSEPGGTAAGDDSSGDVEGSTLAGSAGSDGASSESASHSSDSAASGEASNKSAPPQADEVEAVDLLEVTGSGRMKAGIAVIGAALLAVVLFIRRLFRRKKAD